MALDSKMNLEVYMRFVRDGNGWLCEFVDFGQRVMRTCRFATDDEIRQVAERGRALKNLEAKQMLEYGIATGRGGVTLRLTQSQYEKLKRTD